MNSVDLRILEKIPQLNTLQLVRELCKNDSRLYNAIKAECSTESIDPAFAKAFNQACMHPSLRQILYYRDLKNYCPVRGFHAYSVIIGNMKPMLLKWIVNANVSEVALLQDLGIFIDLELMSSCTTRPVLVESMPCKIMGVARKYDAVKLMADDNVREWYSVYCEYSDTWDIDVKKRIDKDYADLWDYCKNKFGDFHLPILVLTDDMTFGDFELDSLKDYCDPGVSGQEVLMDGSDCSLSITKDFEAMDIALQAKKQHKDTVIVWRYDEKVRDGVKYSCSVDSLLSHNRLRKLADGYVVYAKTQVEYLELDKKGEKEYDYFMNWLPDKYRELFDYMYDEVCTPDEKLNSVVYYGYRDYVLKIIPGSWTEMKMCDLRQVLYNAVQMVKE